MGIGHKEDAGMEALRKRTGIVLVHDELLDRLGDLYRKYPFEMTFDEFLSMVIARMEERYKSPGTGS